MAAPLQQFESTWEKDIERKQLKEAREKYLEKAKSEYEREERKKEAARKKGEGTWMLPSVSERISREEKVIKKKKKAKKKKDKKEKKKKKKSKKKHKKKSDSDSSDSSDSESDDEPKWVEKDSAPVSKSGPQLERQDWMVDPLEDIFGGTTRADIRAVRDKDKKEEADKKALLDMPGQHARELNPFWREGGTGLPEEEIKKKKDKLSYEGRAGDMGIGWLKKAYQRCVETAQEEGRTLEDVAAERYGSLKKLESMLKEAEKKTSRPDERSRGRDSYDRGVSNYRRDYKDRFTKPDDQPKRKMAFMKPGSSENEKQDFQKKKFAFVKPSENDDEEKKSQSWRKSDSDYTPRWKKRNESSGRSRSRSRERGKRSGSRERKGRRSRSSSQERRRSKSRERRRSRSRERRRSRDRSRSRDRGRRSKSKEGKIQNNKETKEKSKENETRDRINKKSRTDSSSSEEERIKKNPRHKRRESSSSHDSSSDSESEDEAAGVQESESEPEPPRVLTEDEMNQLGARIIKAEIMGNEDMAAKLKEELEEARKVKASAPTGPPPTKKTKTDKEVVVLTRTDRAGNVRPIDAIHEGGGSGGRRKKEKVATHAKDGERERYFADDDKFSLKQLVEREKMSTAEDANDMFARLAGRSVEKTDDEYQLDDMLVQRANKKMADSKVADRERTLAIGEHHRMAKATDNCKYCFENVAKHLIVAIGIKVYLCLPSHRSMVPGHCLIVPMQHVLNGTSVDDDVWTEIQVYRKGLTAMFREQEEDAVFMETSMHHKYHPHMVVECVPVPKETGDMAPIFFKKALQECDTEWAQNKKVVDISKKDVRHSVPKGFPYFSVDFGLEGGFAHVIEDEKTIPSYFGREILAGMMDLEPTLWRKPHKEEFEQQRMKVLQFSSMWKPFDWTQKLNTEKDSDSD